MTPGSLRQPMADKGARRTAEAVELGRLERQDAQNVVDIRAHGRRVPGRHAHTLGQT